MHAILCAGGCGHFVFHAGWWRSLSGTCIDHGLCTQYRGATDVKEVRASSTLPAQRPLAADSILTHTSLMCLADAAARDDPCLHLSGWWVQDKKWCFHLRCLPYNDKACHAAVAGKSRKDGDHGPLFHQMMHDINTATFPDPEVGTLHIADSSLGAVAPPCHHGSSQSLACILRAQHCMVCACRGRRRATTCQSATPSWPKSEFTRHTTGRCAVLPTYLDSSHPTNLHASLCCICT